MTSDHHKTGLSPSPRDLLIFALLWVVFCALLGLIAAYRPASMLHAGVFTLSCAAVALVFEKETPVRRKLATLVIPAVLGVLWLAGSRLQGEPESAAQAWMLWGGVAFGVLGTGTMLASRRLKLQVHRFWTNAAKPIGWTVSTTLLALVYFLVFMPIGLLLRLFGHDPLQRGFDRGRYSYWGEHSPPPEPRRYFRQF